MEIPFQGQLDQLLSNLPTLVWSTFIWNQINDDIDALSKYFQTTRDVCTAEEI